MSGQLHNFTTQLLYPWCSMERRLGGPQRWYGHGGEEEKIPACQELNPNSPARSLVTILTEILQLSKSCLIIIKISDTLGLYAGKYSNHNHPR